MSDSDRNEAVEKIIGNMTAELQNVDGQYVSLGFTPPQNEPLNWGHPQYINNFNTFPQNTELPLRYPMEPLNFGYLQQPPNYEMNEYNKSLEALKYNIYQSGDPGVFQNDFSRLNHNLGVNPDMLGPSHGPHPQTSNNHTNHSNPTHLIENLVGNWVPNTSGTYSPFGNDPFKPSVGVFDKLSTSERNVNTRESVIGQILEDPLIIDHNLEEKQFQFNRNRKPRMVAEVKPMRPSYSDVLAKSVPQPVNKPVKIDNSKDTKKEKKDNKKTLKSEKGQKILGNQSQTKSNQNDLKDASNVDKSSVNKGNNEKISKGNSSAQLHRKWASLDNINEPLLNNSKTEQDNKKKKSDENNVFYKSFPQKNPIRKTATKNSFETVENDAENNSKTTNDTFVVNKNGIKKPNSKFPSKQKNSDSFGTSERPVGKRNQRVRKRENNVFFGIVSQKLKQYLKGWWKIITVFLFWLIHLISDICSLSVHISKDMASNFWHALNIHWANFVDTTITIVKRIQILSWIYEKFKKPEQPQQDTNRTFLHSGLQNNINMPTTGEEAMKRLLACKGKDPYSILGVTPTCSDDDIKRYYKRQAFLVHPDKNQQPGAEEAFKILVHAFDMIGEPTRRAAYDKGVLESVQVEQAWSELTELLAQLQQKVEAAANTIRCSACGMRHKRIKVDRPSYAARNCSSCKIHHAAREGDIWAEARCFGFLWHYYACMEGGVYDITEWAGCQKESLKHLRPDSHQVQYRIALGKQNSQPRRHSGSPRNEKPPDLENLLNTLYGQADNNMQQGARKRNKKNNK